MWFPAVIYGCLFLGVVNTVVGTWGEISHESAKRDQIYGDCILPKQPIGESSGLDWGTGGLCNVLPKKRVPSGVLINYVCKKEDGYILQGNSTSFCHFNKWYLPPTCINYCPALNFDGIDALCSFQGEIVSCKFLTAPGTKATLACKDSYKILPNGCDSANKEITCLDGGMWSHTVFKCIPECGIVVPHGRNIMADGSLVEHGSFPWHVAIYEKSSIETCEPICAGTLISPNLVISAAHCFFNESVSKVTNASEILVVAGKYYRLYNISEHYFQKSTVQRIDVTEKRVRRTKNYGQDIVLLRLETPFEMTTLVRPVCMDWYNKHEKEQLRNENSGMTTRWSGTANGSRNDTLQDVHLLFISSEKCLSEVSENLKGSITDDKFCASCFNESISCASDSGGGLYFVFQGVWFLRGITSLTLISDETRDKNYYIPFTNVGYFLEWIRHVYLSTGKGPSDDRDNDAGMNYNYDVLLGEYGSCPWRQPSKHYSQGVVGLHEEIEDFFAYIKLTTEEHKLTLQVIKKIEDVVNDLWPDHKVLPFGSYRTELFLPTSDIDLKIIGMEQMAQMQKLEKALLDRNIVEQNFIKLIENTSVPIVRLVDKETAIRLDISFNNDVQNTGFKSTELIESYKRQFPVLEKLVMVLKQFLVQRGLNGLYTGGISSYNLVLMTVNFLQLHPRRNTYSPNDNLGSLLIEFLELYGRKFDYVESCIRVNDGGAYIPKKDFPCHMTVERRLSILCIEDPFVPGDSITCQSFRAFHLKEVFDQAYSALLRSVSPLNIPVNDANKVSLLGRIIRVPDDVVKYRKWIKKTFPLPLGETDWLPSSTEADASILLGANDTDFDYSRNSFSDKVKVKENKKILPVA